MAVTFGDVPLIDPSTGRLPDTFAPPSVAANTELAVQAATASASTASEKAAIVAAAQVALPPVSGHGLSGELDFCGLG